MSNQTLDLIQENSNMIYSICNKYGNYSDIEDLYQVGVIGLIKALENFDSSMNVKFSTYAFPYIVGEVSKYSRENRNIKLTKDLVRLGKKINEYINKYKEVRGYKPTIKEMATTFGIKEEKIISAIESINEVRSLDEIITDNNSKTLIDTISTTDIVSSEQLIDLRDAFSCLNGDEKELIIGRYFNDLTQKEFAEILGVNQVYVSRMEKKALSKMRKVLN